MTDWTGLLKWSLKHTDGTSSSQPRQMTAEDREFLEQALKAATVDPVGRLKELTRITKLPDDPNAPPSSAPLTAPLLLLPAPAGEPIPPPPQAPARAAANDVKDEDLPKTEEECVQRKLAALEEIDDIVLQIDYAQDLHKIGGLVPIIRILGSKYASLQAQAAQVIATCCQNNPQCQRWAVEHDVIPALMALLRPGTSEKVLAKTLYALRPLITSNEQAESLFMASDGYSVLTQLLKDPATVTPVKVKVLNLLRHFWSQPVHRQLPHDSAIPAVLVSLLNHEFIDIRESTLRAISDLTSNCPANVQLFTAQSIRSRLLARRAEIAAFPAEEDREQCKDELEIINNLVTVFP